MIEKELLMEYTEFLRTAVNWKNNASQEAETLFYESLRKLIEEKCTCYELEEEIDHLNYRLMSIQEDLRIAEYDLSAYKATCKRNNITVDYDAIKTK